MSPRPAFPLVAAALSLVLAPMGASQGRRPTAEPVPAGKPNLLLVVLDDVGVDLVSAYGEPSAACTPMIDALAAGGLLFRHAWANPHCSATRAQLMTGRHGFRTGVGTAINQGGAATETGLQHSETTLAEALAAQGYATAAFGKWHLGPAQLDPTDPLQQGFAWYEGSVAGTLDPETTTGTSGCPSCPLGCREGALGYHRWVKSTNGIETCETRYATSVNVDDALAVLAGGLAEPWFLYVAFNAPHSPYHQPPAALCPGLASCACDGEVLGSTAQAKAMLEAADVELGRLIAGVGSLARGPLTVVVVGDNGTPSDVAQGPPGGCFDPQRSKGTVYQGGVHVPMVVAGAGVRIGEVEDPVGVIDLFATLLELGGGTSVAEDSISLVPYLHGTQGSLPLRDFVYAEGFGPNGLPFAPTKHQRAIHDGRFKLIRRTGLSDQLFDLEADPCESVDLYPPDPGSPAAQAYHALDLALADLGVG